MATPKLAVRRTDFDSPEDLAPAFERLSAGRFSTPDTSCCSMLERQHPHDPKAANLSRNGLTSIVAVLMKLAWSFSRAAQLAPG
jgi:hypothetical protein